ncbi:hypothetical protein V9T40_012741 [Parthenolecanium corni]|uniref:Uncharacterized protein n=1 Tax=Parthenolecanium corni TaxID=536013 RepID=A0AAN9T8A6_9HEMI
MIRREGHPKSRRKINEKSQPKLVWIICYEWKSITGVVRVRFMAFQVTTGCFKGILIVVAIMSFSCLRSESTNYQTRQDFRTIHFYSFTLFTTDDTEKMTRRTQVRLGTVINSKIQALLDTIWKSEKWKISISVSRKEDLRVVFVMDVTKRRNNLTLFRN